MPRILLKGKLKWHGSSHDPGLFVETVFHNRHEFMGLKYKHRRRQYFILCWGVTGPAILWILAVLSLSLSRENPVWIGVSPWLSAVFWETDDAETKGWVERLTRMRSRAVVPLLTSCAYLGKLINLSEPQFLHTLQEKNRTCHKRVLRELCVCNIYIWLACNIHLTFVPMFFMCSKDNNRVPEWGGGAVHFTSGIWVAEK